MNKKIIIITMLILLMLSTSAFAAANFKDVPANAWYQDSLEYTTNNGIINGYPDGTFKPEATLSRAEFTKVVVYSLYGEQKRFLNIIGKWYAPYYDKGEDEGLLPASFVALDKESPITRGEMATIIARLPNLSLDKSKGKANISDFNSIPKNQQESVITTYQSGIINGYPDGTFKADQTLTRAQLAKVAELVDKPDKRGEEPLNSDAETTNLDVLLDMELSEWNKKEVDEKLKPKDGWTYNPSTVGKDINLNGIINTNPLLLQVPSDDIMYNANTWFDLTESIDSSVTWRDSNALGTVFSVFIDGKKDASNYTKGAALLENFMENLKVNPYQVTYKRTLSDSEVDRVLNKVDDVISIDKAYKELHSDILNITYDESTGRMTEIDWDSIPQPIPEEINSIVKVSVNDYNFYIQPKGGLITISMLDTQHPDFDEIEYLKSHDLGHNDHTFMNYGDDWEDFN